MKKPRFCYFCRYSRIRNYPNITECNHRYRRRFVRDAVGERYERLICIDVNANNNCELWEPRFLARIAAWVMAKVKE